ncbi:MAG: hypothetical protein K0S39_2199 [Paenibacillus sp.]|jgi:hypothetical protein|nr:hypothetical protein [Paenibacillus sp.]
MNPKQILIVGTMVLTITVTVTFGGEIWGRGTGSSSLIENFDGHNGEMALKDDFLQVLGVSSDEEVYYSLLDGKSLANIADENHKGVQDIINLQIAELTEQLDRQLANGSIHPSVYQAQKEELADIVRKSVYGEMNT